MVIRILLMLQCLKMMVSCRREEEETYAVSVECSMGSSESKCHCT